MKKLKFSVIILSILLLLLGYKKFAFIYNPKTDVLSASKPNNNQMKIVDSIFKGFTNKMFQYEVKSKQSIRTLDNKFLLQKVQAKYPINSHQILYIESQNGIFDDAFQTLFLQGNVIFTLDEAVINTLTAELKLLNNNILAKSGVTCFYKKSILIADRFFTMEDNNILEFNGRVLSIINITDF